MNRQTLRQRFTIYLPENRTDSSYIQSLLGLPSSKTTEIYTHISTKGMEKIIRPLFIWQYEKYY